MTTGALAVHACAPVLWLDSAEPWRPLGWVARAIAGADATTAVVEYRILWPASSLAAPAMSSLLVTARWHERHWVPTAARIPPDLFLGHPGAVVWVSDATHVSRVDVRVTAGSHVLAPLDGEAVVPADVLAWWTGPAVGAQGITTTWWPAPAAPPTPEQHRTVQAWLRSQVTPPTNSFVTRVDLAAQPRTRWEHASQLVHDRLLTLLGDHPVPRPIRRPVGPLGAGTPVVEATARLVDDHWELDGLPAEVFLATVRHQHVELVVFLTSAPPSAVEMLVALARTAWCAPTTLWVAADDAQLALLRYRGVATVADCRHRAPATTDDWVWTRTPGAYPDWRTLGPPGADLVVRSR